MSDYISRQAAIDALDRIFDNIPMELTTEILRLRRELRGLPSADVVPVVRCRDCKHWESEDGYCHMQGTEDWKADDFCNYSKRREE